MREQQAYTTNQTVPPGAIDLYNRKPRHTTQDEDDGGYDDQWPGRLPSSSRRYYMPDVQGNVTIKEHKKPLVVPPRRSAAPAPETAQPAPRRRSRFHLHPLAWLGIGAIAMLLLYIAWWNVNNWWTGVQQDWQYTSAFRTYSVDAVVGHNGDSTAHPSHFIVQNDKRHILIIELPADDEKKAVIYRAPVLIGDGGEKTPITITFVTNSQTGRLDMVLHVEDQSYIYTNNGTQFIAPPI